MLEPHEILDDLIAWFQPKPMAGRRVLITAGPTRAADRPGARDHQYVVRQDGLRDRAGGARGGCDGDAGLGDRPRWPRRAAWVRIDVDTARQMHDAVMAEVGGADCFIAVAAVADWHVVNAADHKLKKKGGAFVGPVLEFAENPDILAAVAARENAPYTVGFAAETEDLDANAERKLVRKKAGMIVGNLAGDAFGRDDNALTLYDGHGRTTLARADKLVLARQLIVAIAERMAAR